MTRFARVYGGRVLDPIEVPQASDIQGRYTPDYISSVGGLLAWIGVADGTEHGATDNGDGTYTNPSPPPHTPVPVAATLAQIVDAIPAVKYRLWETAKATSDNALKHWNVFHAQTSFTPQSWDSWGDAFETEGLLTNAQTVTFKAAKTVA